MAMLLTLTIMRTLTMSKKIVAWDNQTAQKELAKRLREADEFRSRFTAFWEQNEQLMFDAEGQLNTSSINSHPEFGTYRESSSLDSAQVNQNSAYAFRNLNFIHSQMSASPPSVIAEPTTSDPDDRLAALAADRLVDHGRTTYDLAGRIDALTLNTLVYGTGYFKIVWDSGQGEIIDVDEAGNLQLEGDISIRIPSVWNMYIDQHADERKNIRYMFERIYMELSHAQAKWPEYADILERSAAKNSGNPTHTSTLSDDKPGREVEIYEYWEKGLPENGYDGRHCLCLKDGTILGEIKPNPHRFLAAETVRKIKEKYGDMGEAIVAAKLELIPQKAELPYHILTHVDVPQIIYGKSVLDYVGPIQNNLNRLMLTVLDNAAAHGAARLVLPAGSEVADDSIVNTSFQIIKVSGQAGPYPIQMPTLLGDLGPLMDREKQQIDDIMGVNDSQFGTMQRETSNAALQSAAAQGSMIRRNLFNKYGKVVEDIYRQYLKLVRKHIDIDRLYHIIGKEHPLEALEVKTIDLDGGYDIKVSYGSSMSLDPLTRRGEIMQLMPFFKETGVPQSTIVDMLQLNELRGLYDKNRVAKERQMEIFDEMIESLVYTPPEPNQDHTGMLAAALEYVMTREYFDLPPEAKVLISQHIEERKQMGASEQTTGQAAPGGMPPVGGLPPAGAPPLPIA